MSVARLLTGALARPDMMAGLGPDRVTEVMGLARAELLAGALAERLAGTDMPPKMAEILDEVRTSSRFVRKTALWEAEMARRALVPLGMKMVLLKGTAYAAAGLDAAAGRSIGDLDILVPRSALDAAERALIAHGWEWVKDDPYDQQYYRRWMHELPPLIHRIRDRMIDVHHTILPPTAKPTPDAALMIADAVSITAGAGDGVLGPGLSMLSPADMIVHAACHLFADGDLAGGLRNLWDIDRLLRQFSPVAGLAERARRHGLGAAVGRALRLAATLYGTPLDAEARAAAGRARPADRLYVRRLLARDGWGRPTRPATRLAFYVRSHAIRMPPAMLLRHLWIKASKQRRG